MNKDLLQIADEFIEVMKTTEGVLGAWNFGSAVHGCSDEYSDVDLVFLISHDVFREMEQQLSVFLSGMCEELVLCFREGFNNKAIIANSYLLRKEQKLLQFDVVLINKANADHSMCKIFYTDLSETMILFDVDGQVAKLCRDCPRGTVWNDKPERIGTTYLLYFHMTAKYLNRRDYFQLNHAIRMLYDAHASLLLTGYDAVCWGGAEKKLGFLPAEKQKHLKNYQCTQDFGRNRERLLQSVKWFEEDLCNISALKGQTFDSTQIAVVRENWEKETCGY